MPNKEKIAEGSTSSGERSKKTPRREFLEQAGLTAGVLTAGGLLAGAELASGQKRTLPSQLEDFNSKPITTLIHPKFHQRLTPNIRNISRKQLAALATGGPHAPKNITLGDIKSFVDVLVNQHGGSALINPDYVIAVWPCPPGTNPTPTPTPNPTPPPDGGGGWSGSCCCCAASVSDPVRRVSRLA
jgi:hypothetical protein